MSSQSDSGLQTALQQLRTEPGDDQAWRVLYTALWPFVIARMYRDLRGVGPLAEDAAQEVFIRLARYGRFTALADAGELRRYVARIARNVSRDTWRKTLRLQVRSLDEPAVGELPAEGESIERSFETHERVRAAFSRLEARDRQILRHLAHGWTIAEIAAQTNMSYALVAVRIHRARRRMERGAVPPARVDDA
jgi:RNA polymerase sigma factor (sigma-70 family)